MRDYIVIGPAPAGENCVQVGDPEYYEKSLLECKRFRRQLLNTFGKEPKTARLDIKEFHHDFGVYREVVCYYDDNDPIGTEYCFTVEANMPEHWE